MKENWFKKHKVLTVILVLVIIGIIYGSGSDKNSSTYKSTSSSVRLPETTPSPTIVVGKVEVKSETKKMNRGYTKIVGEVINNTNKAVEYVKVTATFYDKNDNVIGTSFTYAGDTASTPLQPNETTPFEVTSYPDEINADKYKLDVNWR